METRQQELDKQFARYQEVTQAVDLALVQGIKSEDASRHMGILRTTFFSRLKQARQKGLHFDLNPEDFVQFTFTQPSTGSNLSRSLNLQSVNIVEVPSEVSSNPRYENLLNRWLGKASALYVQDILRPGDSVGIESGPAISEMTSQWAQQGSLRFPILSEVTTLSVAANQEALQLAQTLYKIRGDHPVLHLKLFNEGSNAAEQLKPLDVAIFQDIDEDSRDQISEAQIRIYIDGGQNNVPGILEILRERLVTHFVTDSLTAKAIITKSHQTD